MCVFRVLFFLLIAPFSFVWVAATKKTKTVVEFLFHLSFLVENSVCHNGFDGFFLTLGQNHHKSRLFDRPRPIGVEIPINYYLSFIIICFDPPFMDGIWIVQFVDHQIRWMDIALDWIDSCHTATDCVYYFFHLSSLIQLMCSITFLLVF